MAAPVATRVPSAREFLAAPDHGEWKAGTTWREKAAVGAVRAMRAQWAVDHHGQEPRSTIVTPVGAAVKKVAGDDPCTEADAVRLVKAARVVARAVDLWARAFALRFGEQPVRSDAVVAITETLDLIYEGRDAIRVLHAAEEAGHHGDPWISTAYREILTDKRRHRGDTLDRVHAELRLEESLRAEGRDVTRAEVREIAFQERYGLSWRLRALPSRMDLAIERAERREAEGPDEDSVWAGLFPAVERVTWANEDDQEQAGDPAE